MLSGHGMIDGNVDRMANRRPRHMLRRSLERKNQLNSQFERQLAELESKHLEQSQRCIVLTIFPRDVYWKLAPSLSPLHVENGNNHLSSGSPLPVDILESSSPPPMILLHVNLPNESDKRYSDNSSRPSAVKCLASDNSSNSDFLVNSVTKTSTNVKRAARKKGKKKSNRYKRAHCRKPSNGSEFQCGESKDGAPAIDIADGEALTLSPKYVADILFEDTSSPSSSVKEISEEAPDSENDNEYHCCSVASISSVSCSDEMELSGLTTSYLEFGEQFGSNNCSYLDSASNSTVKDSSLDGCYRDISGNCGHDTEALLSVRNECGCAPSEWTDFGDSSHGIDENCLDKSNHCFVGNNICYKNVVDTCNGAQEVQFSSDAGDDSDFHLVISRKRARRKRKMQLCGSFNGEYWYSGIHGRKEKDTGRSPRQMVKELNTKDCTRKPSNVCIQSQHGVALKDSKTRVSLHHFAGPNENHSGKSQKYPNVGKVLNSGFSKVRHGLDSNKILSKSVNIRETDGCQMRSSPASELATQNFVKGKCTSESSEVIDCKSNAIPMQTGGPQALLPLDDTTHTNTELPSPDMTSSRDSLQNFTDIEQKPQNKKEKTAWNKLCSMECGLDTQAASSQSGVYTADQLNNSIIHTQNDSELECVSVPAVEGNQNLNDRRFLSSGKHLDDMIKAVKDAYEVQVAADVHLVAGHPIADFETFIYSATPVIDRIPCMKSGNCLPEQLVVNSLCQHQISNVSLKSMWEWYEEPGCYGLEVKARDSLNSKRSNCNGSEFHAYFVPYLSAVQLFGQPRKNLHHNPGAEKEALFKASNTSSSMSSGLLPQPCNRSNACLLESSSSVQDHGELLFEYFESEQPSLRRPLFEKIKELVSGVKPSDCQIFGDPEKLENVKLCDLRPASWFSVAWYPICRIPHGNFRAAFLTYHSLGKLVPQTCSSDISGGLTCVVSPVVGLQNYNNKGEQWFQLRDPEFKPISFDDAPNTDRSEILKERLRTLRRSASVMARAVVSKGSEESVNRHPDYEFFLSRSN